MDTEHIVAISRQHSSTLIVIFDYMQSLRLIGTLADNLRLYPNKPPPVELDPDCLLINVRLGDVIDGVGVYPLLPIDYYKYLSELTGRRIVFCGQLDQSEYTARLRIAFPDAKFLESFGPMGDFYLLRSAKHVAISVSTFSWFAAWLSSSETIYMPICGFLNPAHVREVDLIPFSDARYRFVLFPIYFGQPLSIALNHHKKLSGSWKLISPSQAQVLSCSSSRIPSRRADLPFDPVWYCHAYIDAAMEISEGWFADALHHYLEVGYLRGYKSTPATSLIDD